MTRCHCVVHDQMYSFYSKPDILARGVQTQPCKINAQKCYTVYEEYKSYIQIKWKKKKGGWQYAPFRAATGKAYCL